jgi:methyl-accepting chemotaxis protein
MFRRFLGFLMVLIGLSGVWVGVISAASARNVVDSIGTGLDTNLDLLSQSLDTIGESLTLAKQTVSDMNEGLVTIEQTADNISLALTDTQPLLTEVGDIVSNDVPDSIEAVQDSLPNVVEVAGAIDRTLTTLNNFAVDRSIDIPNPITGRPIYSFNLNFDLGIDYDPNVPFDQTVRDLGTSIEGLPEQLRGLAEHVDRSSANLQNLSDTIVLVGDDLAVVNGRIAELDPLLDEYGRIVTELNDQTRLLRASINAQLEGIKQMVNIVMIWFILTQIAPLYLGWELVTGRRMAEIRELKVAVEDLQETVEEDQEDIEELEEKIA